MVKYITSYTSTTNFNIFTCKSAYHTLCILGIIQQLNVLQYNTLNSTLTYVTISVKTRLVHTIKKKLFTKQYLQYPRNGPPKFQPSVVCSFGIIALDTKNQFVQRLHKTTGAYIRSHNFRLD